MRAWCGVVGLWLMAGAVATGAEAQDGPESGDLAAPRPRETGAERPREAGAERPPEPWGQPAASPPPQVLPMRYAERPLTLPRGTVRIDATFAITSQEREALDRQTYVSFLGVAGFGVTDDIELGVIALPLQISPEGRFNDPGLYGLLRILSTDSLDLGLQLEATVPVRDSSAFSNALSGRVLWRASEIFRLDFAASLVAFYQDPIETSLRFPIVGTFQLTESFFLGVQTGLDVDYVSGADERAGRKQNAFIPAGVFVGGSLRGEEGPTGDLRLGVFLASVTDGFDLWQLGFGGNFYIY